MPQGITGKVNKPGEGSAKNQNKKARQKRSKLRKREKAAAQTKGTEDLYQPPLHHSPASLTIGPDTPTWSHQQRVVAATGKDDSATSSAVAHLSRSGAQADACRADLSGAALLLLQQFVKTPCDTDSSAQPQAAIGQKHRKAHINGNYSNYYGYRWAAGETEDPRLQVMERRWFVNKRCLDIGCNEGILTLAIASKLASMSMLGIDIDAKLIRRACGTLHEERTEAAKRRGAISQEKASASEMKAATEAVRSLSNVWFRQGDFVNSKLEDGSVDTVTCLSVTKWIHVHGGDEVLRSFFKKVKDVLSPGGYFILEPQPWKSYKRALQKLDKAGASHVDLQSIKLPPEQFPNYLMHQLGFRLLKQLKVPSPVPGFDRPLYWFKKQ